MTVCNARQLRGVLKCEADHNHEGDHWAIVNKKHVRWENRFDKPTRALGGRTSKKGSSLRQKTKKQELLDARWAGIKDTLLFLGYGCAQANDSCFGPLDLDHKQSRAQGGSYDVANGEILCRFHHRQKHGDVQFSGSAS